MKNYIYCLSHPITEETVYIGKTKDTIKRYKDHCRKEKNFHKTNLSKWKNEIFLQGLKPVLTILYECDEQIDYWEKFYILLFKSWGINLLNMTEGGDGLQNPSEETRRKIGEKSKGRIPSIETRKKLSEINYNTGKKILCYDINGIFIEEFINARRAGEKLNISYKNISQTLNEDKHFYKNYTFFYKEEENIEEKLRNRISKTAKKEEFYRIDKLGNTKEYNNLLEAGKDNNLNFKNIWSCLKKKRQFSGEYAWVYKNNFSEKINYFEKKSSGKKIKVTFNNEIIIFDSSVQAAEKLGMHKTTICNYLKGKSTPKNGYIFEYVS
jgi:hypothetical protein